MRPAATVGDKFIGLNASSYLTSKGILGNGEIVWVPVKPIKRTSNSRGSLTAATTVEEHKASLKMLKIDYWPGLIKEPRLISRPVKKETMGRVITQTWDYVCSCIAIDQ
jgi:hypothetical protein